MLLCWLSYICTWTRIWWVPRESKGTCYKTCCWWSFQEGCWTRTSGILSLFIMMLTKFILMFLVCSSLKLKITKQYMSGSYLVDSMSLWYETMGLLFHWSATILKFVADCILLAHFIFYMFRERFWLSSNAFFFFSLNFVKIPDRHGAVSEGPQVHKIWRRKQCNTWVWRRKIGIERLLHWAHCFLKCSGSFLFNSCNILLKNNIKEKLSISCDMHGFYFQTIRTTCW